MVDQEADGKDGETLKANDRGDTASDGDSGQWDTSGSLASGQRQRKRRNSSGGLP